MTTKPTLMEKIRDRREHRGDKGLALLDVLIGMAIFALIALIAVQAIGQFRARAYETSAKSDANQTSVAIESSYTDTNNYPATFNAAALGVNLSNGNSVVYTPPAAGADDYTFCVVNAKGPWAAYKSAKGSIVESGRTGGATACAGAL